jgi:hypothetical protein
MSAQHLAGTHQGSRCRLSRIVERSNLGFEAVQGKSWSKIVGYGRLHHHER